MENIDDRLFYKQETEKVLRDISESVGVELEEIRKDFTEMLAEEKKAHGKELSDDIIFARVLINLMNIFYKDPEDPPPQIELYQRTKGELKLISGVLGVLVKDLKKQGNAMIERKVIESIKKEIFEYRKDPEKFNGKKLTERQKLIKVMADEI